MRRTVVVGATVLVVVVLATPVRHRLSAGVESVAAELRERVAAFRADYAAREAELRERLLPDDADVAAAAERRRPEHS